MLYVYLMSYVAIFLDGCLTCLPMCPHATDRVTPPYASVLTEHTRNTETTCLSGRRTATHVASAHVRRGTDDERWCVNLSEFCPKVLSDEGKQKTSLFTLIQMVGWLNFQNASLLFSDISPSPLGAIGYLSHADWNEDLGIMEFRSFIRHPPCPSR